MKLVRYSYVFENKRTILLIVIGFFFYMSVSNSFIQKNGVRWEDGHLWKC